MIFQVGDIVIGQDSGITYFGTIVTEWIASVGGEQHVKIERDGYSMHFRACKCRLAIIDDFRSQAKTGRWHRMRS